LGVSSKENPRLPDTKEKTSTLRRRANVTRFGDNSAYNATTVKFLSSIATAITLSLLSFLFPDIEQQNLDTNQPPQTQDHMGTVVRYKQDTYKIHWFTIEDIDNLSLHPNFESKSDSSMVFEALECRYLINGGFYSKESTPIGWFKSDSVTLSEPEKNNLFNGYFSLIHNKLARIERTTESIDMAHTGVQTGPILIQSSTVNRLNLNQDKRARRSFAATTDENLLILGMVTQEKSDFDGPLLVDLGSILKTFSDQENLNITQAINLDGGSASVYISPDEELLEINPVGSFFCLH